MGRQKRCEGLLTPGQKADLPYLRRCRALAHHGDYCVLCFQRRKQNDSMRKCLISGWDRIIEGDSERTRKPTMVLHGKDKEAAEALKDGAMAVVPASAVAAVIPASPPPPPVATPTPTTTPVPHDYFAAAREALASMTKR